MRYLIAASFILFSSAAWAAYFPPGTSYPPGAGGGGGGGGPAVPAPVNTVAPVVTGTAKIGSVLTSTQGSWTGTTSITFQWMRSGTAITGATSSTYTLVTADFGSAITSVVTGSNASGSITSLSNWSGQITGAGANPATPLNYFLNSLGLNTHMGQGHPASEYETIISYTGIRNIRDTGGTGQLSTLLAFCAAEPGVLIADLEFPPISNAKTNGIALFNAGCLGAVEGLNEPNNFTEVYPTNSNNHANTGGGPGSASWIGVAAYQADLYAWAHSALPGIPVYGTSEDGAESDNVGLQLLSIPIGFGACGANGTLGSLICIPDGTQYADFANPHNYVEWPSSSPIVANQAFDSEFPTCAEPTGDGVDGLCNEYGHTWGEGYAGYNDTQLNTVPRVTTETGWNSDPVPNPPNLTGDQQGKLYINLFLDGMLEGWTKTYLYQAIDSEGGLDNFGIYANATTPKLSATYLHNMTTFLADTTTITPGSYAYSIASEPSTVHDRLFQGSNGKFWIAVWDEQTTASGLTDAITVTLPATATVKEFDATVGTAAVTTFTSVNSINLTLSDHALFLQVQ